MPSLALEEEEEDEDDDDDEDEEDEGRGGCCGKEPDAAFTALTPDSLPACCRLPTQTTARRSILKRGSSNDAMAGVLPVVSAVS
jgi:hypothetical protein